MKEGLAGAPATALSLVLPLALSGTVAISVVVIAALGLLWVLLRGEAGYEGDDEPQEDQPPDRGEQL